MIANLKAKKTQNKIKTEKAKEVQEIHETKKRHLAKRLCSPKKYGTWFQSKNENIINYSIICICS